MNKKIMILILVVGLLTTIIAQPKGTGSISGTIRDSAQNGLANAAIEAFLGTQRIAATRSDAKGAYKLTQLNPGKYTVIVKLTGYKTSTEDVTVNAAKNSIHNVTLKVDEVVLMQEQLESSIYAKGDIRATASGRSGNVMMDMSGPISGAYAAPYPGRIMPPHDTEEYAAINPNIFHSPLTEPLSTFSIDVDTANYSNLRRYLNQGQLPPKNSIRIEELINYFSYDYPEPKGQHPFSVYTEMGVNPWNQKRNLVHIGIKGRAIDLKTAPASNLVFLIDVSGSMNSPQKLPLVKESMKMLVENLRPQDKIAMVVYAGKAGLVLPSSDGAEKAKIIQAIDNLEAGGSTAGGAGIRLAYETALDNLIKGGNNRIILCTDGDFNVGVSSTADLEGLVSEYRSKGVFLTVLGYGMGNYK
ncbi:MAG TPA: von Willebrand factor type A domain-containing protein, partial [Candidatus Cloacimonadota bacterium]|nr:von Willebrand factor type A domain-containing protein [Candidatus Cloacimonadota bacterium]